ncbi:MAG: ATP synthase F1 subunit delta [Lentisphaerae bacterium RIFOXYC12_FULL_60_16]|nr:MAG: ATP synthase F1 subunit delta [Lentisphaerae bacterium RIFOXYC12_FULL_60_16]OGV84931.1 MAG: ATP synthase F1 subunit delta [Lentisphaerae bacterium RIFOXYB12_FULL_60_10]
MIKEIVAARYARAFCTVASGRGNLEAASAELLLAAEYLVPGRRGLCIPELMEILRAPHLTADEKRGFLQLLAGRLALGALTVRFLEYLTQRRRIGLVYRIAVHLRERTARQFNMLVAEAESAHAMSDEQCHRIRDALCRALATPIQLVAHVNPRLLCGVRIQVDGRLYDGSALGMLERLGTRLMT